MLARYLRASFDLVAVVHDGRKLVEAAKRLRPDIVVADISMPEMSGLDAMRRLRADGLETRFLFLTMHADPALAARAMKAGASGFVLKNSAGDELTTAITEALKGRVYLTPLLARDTLAAMAAPAAESSIDRLSLRQREVLQLLVRGRSMKEIAAAMNLSPRTIETHKYEMMHVLGIQTNAELIQFAFHSGLAPA
jgi:DNA-binding NarL/FixJ family response regulator